MFTKSHVSGGEATLVARMGRRIATRLVGVAAMLLVPIVGGGCATDRTVIEQANQFHGELSKAVMDDPALANYVQTVGDRIIETAKSMNEAHYKPKSESDENNAWMFSSDVKFHFVNSKTLNAFTTGGEHMYIYTELFRQCKNEGELAGVMAHEYGHVFGRHIHNGMNRQMVAMLGAGSVAALGYAAGGKEHGQEYAGYGAGLGMLAAGLANAGFTRGDEAEADQLGFDFYVRSGWDPDQFAGFFRTILAMEQKKGGGGPEFLSDHPSTDKRIKAAEERSRQWKQKHPDWRELMRPDVAAGSRFRELQQRATELGKNLPDDSSLNKQTLLAALPRSCMFPDEPRPPAAQQAQQRIAAAAEQQQQQQQQQGTQQQAVPQQQKSNNKPRKHSVEDVR